MKTHQILRRCLCDNSNVWNIVSKRFKFKGSFAEYSVLMKKNKEERSMGKGNAAVKQWLGNPRRFADLFNGIVFQGKQVILPEDLHPATGETDILVSDKNEKAKEVQRYRDIIMRWEQGAYLVLLACENQENVHYAMTVRNMLYDSLSYVEQIRQSWKCLEAAEKQKVAEAEFLSRFRKEDRLVPVITLVFYYHPDVWDGSQDLYGILRWSEDEDKNEILKKYISNYRINLIDAGNVKELERFHTDLQEIFGMLQCRQDKEKLLHYVKSKEQYFRHVDEETYQVLREFLHSETILKQAFEKEKREEQVDMCKALEDLYQDGIEQGAVEAYQEVGFSKEEIIERVQKKFSCAVEKAEEIVEKYWKE